MPLKLNGSCRRENVDPAEFKLDRQPTMMHVIDQGLVLFASLFIAQCADIDETLNRIEWRFARRKMDVSIRAWPMVNEPPRDEQ